MVLLDSGMVAAEADCCCGGVCCIDSVCSTLSESDCNAAGGIFKGSGTCDPNPCCTCGYHTFSGGDPDACFFYQNCFGGLEEPAPCFAFYLDYISYCCDVDGNPTYVCFQSRFDPDTCEEIIIVPSTCGDCLQGPTQRVSNPCFLPSMEATSSFTDPFFQNN